MTDEGTLPEENSGVADAVQGGSLGWTDDGVASEPHVLNKLRALRGPGESQRRRPAAGRDGGEGAALTGFVAQTHLRMAARRGAQKPGLVDMVSPIFIAPASVFTEAGGV
jgi:hypothetical protein